MINPLGRITVGAGESKNNTNTTGTPFTLVADLTAISIFPSADGYVLIRPEGKTVANPSTLAATDPTAFSETSGWPLKAGSGIQFSLRGGGSNTWTVAVYSAAGGNFDVYATLS